MLGGKNNCSGGKLWIGSWLFHLLKGVYFGLSSLQDPHIYVAHILLVHLELKNAALDTVRTDHHGFMDVC